MYKKNLFSFTLKEKEKNNGFYIQQVVGNI